MLYQKIRQFWINIFPNKGKNVMVLSLALLMLCVGCKQNTDDEDDETDVDKTEQQIYGESEKLAETYREIYRSIWSIMNR